MFYSGDPGLPQFDKEPQNRAKILAATLNKIAKQQEHISQAISRSFFNIAIKDGIFKKAGVTEFGPIWAFELGNVKFRFIIILRIQ